jgi:hypothetical protein
MQKREVMVDVVVVGRDGSGGELVAQVAKSV